MKDNFMSALLTRVITLILIFLLLGMGCASGFVFMKVNKEKDIKTIGSMEDYRKNIKTAGSTEESPKTTKTAANVPEAEQDYANVKDFGAVGDARYHSHIGQVIDGRYYVDHFSALSESVFYLPYNGDKTNKGSYKTIVSNGTSLKGKDNLIRKRDVVAANPGADKFKVADNVIDIVMADPNASVKATDDTAAFEKAIEAGNGCLYLPEGDYMVSQLAAAKIEKISGPGRIWLKEWLGGDPWDYSYGKTDFYQYRGFGWIDAQHFEDEAWRSMHWITAWTDTENWKSSEDFSGLFSSRLEYPFDATRTKYVLWMTIQPRCERSGLPETFTICLGKDSAGYYTLEGSEEWYKCSSGLGGFFCDLHWNGNYNSIDHARFVDCGDHYEISVSADEFFKDENGETVPYGIHCWTEENSDLAGMNVQYTLSRTKIWVKETEAAGKILCDIGGDLYTGDEHKDEYGYIHEAYDSCTYALSTSPSSIYAYSVSDEDYDRYMNSLNEKY